MLTMTSVIMVIVSITLVSIARMTLRLVTHLSQRCMRAARNTLTGRIRTFIRSLGLSRTRTTSFVLYFFVHKLTVLLKKILECSDSLGKWIGSLLLVLQEVEKQTGGDRRPTQSKTNSLKVLSFQPGYRSVTTGSPTAKPNSQTTFLSVRTLSHDRFTRPKSSDDESNTSELDTCTSYPDTVSTSVSAGTSQDCPTHQTTPSANLNNTRSHNSIAPRAKKSLTEDRLASFDRQDTFMSTLSLHEEIGGSSYGSVYRGSAIGGELLAIKITRREKTPEHDSLLRGEVSAMERATSSVWAAKLRYWQSSKDHLLITMVSERRRSSSD